MSKKITNVNSQFDAKNRLKPNFDDQLIGLRKSGTESMHVNRAGYENVSSNIGSILDLLERGFESISNMIHRLRELIVMDSNCLEPGVETVQKFQDEIDLLMVEISHACADLPVLPSNWIMTAPEVVDIEKAGLLATTIDLHYLGLDKGIKVFPKYRDILVSYKDALFAEVEMSASDEQRINAMNKLESHDRALKKFPRAMERFIAVCLENNVSPFNEGTYSADRLADALNKASQVNPIDGLTGTDIDLLAGSSENFGTFLEQVKQVMPLPVNLNIVATAYDRVCTQLSITIAIRNQIELALRSIPNSDQQLSSAEERLSGQNIIQTLPQINKPKSEEQLKSDNAEKDIINQLIR